MTSVVFTPEWISSLKKRYERAPDHSKPFLLRAATEEYFAYIRNEIEDWIKCWDGPSRVRMIKHLQDPNQFRHAYHELAVDSLLRRIGVRPMYEENIDGLTPDFPGSRSYDR